MSFEIEFTHQAETDLREIIDYISSQLQSPGAAATFFNLMRERVKSLHSMPHRFRRYAHEPWYSRNLRIMSVDNYLAFFIPQISSTKDSDNNHDTSQGIVTILRIMYAGRNIAEQLGSLTNFPDKS